MSLFDSLNGKHTQANPMQKLQELKQNPASVLQQAGFNIPEDMKDPNQITQYLLSSGQVSQNKYSQVLQMIGRR